MSAFRPGAPWRAVFSPPRYGISAKFILFVTLAVVLFLSVVLFASFTIMRRYSLEDARELATTILDETNIKINRFFQEVEFLARGLAGYRAVSGVEVEHMKDLFVSTVVARRQYLRAIYLGTEDGRMYEWGWGEGFREHTPTLPPGYDPRRRPWYLAALRSGDYTISEPYIYASVEALGITGVIPVRRGGALVGVLGIDILLDDLQGLLASLEIPKNGRAILINEKGEIIASQYAPLPRRTLELERFEVRDAAELLAERAGSFVETIEGRRILFNFKINDETGWVLLLGLPYESILEAAGQVLTMMAVVDALLMILLMIALFLITRRMILAPLGEIISVINRLEGGEKQVRVRVRAGVDAPADEFAVLGNELNKLADTVEEYSTRLEEKVRERTEEIARLEAENTRLRIVEEQERIYRDLHDSLGARLTNIGICNTVARNVAARGNRRLGEMLERIGANCDQAIVHLKEIVLGRHEQGEPEAEFTRLLEGTVRRRLKPQEVEAACRFEGEAAIDGLGDPLKEELQKLLQELVSNVLKHARASRVELELGVQDGSLALRFADDGVGFDWRRERRAGYGLKSIVHRVERLGGRVSVSSAPGEGAAYTITIPLEKSADESESEGRPDPRGHRR